MELARQIHNLLPDALMVFVTAHYKYAVDAYELHIFRYIPKNQLKERLSHALKDAVSLLEIQNTDSYIVSSQNRLERIPFKEILYIEKDGKNAIFHITETANRSMQKVCRNTGQIIPDASANRLRKFLMSYTPKNFTLLNGDIS